MNEGKKRKKRVVSGNSSGVQVVVPYIKGLSEACAGIYNRYGAKTTMRPFQTMRNSMVYAKYEVKVEEVSEVVYRTQCKSCDKVYVEETGRNFEARINEH